jgi:hypothetical protein
MGSMTTNKIDYPSMLAGYGDFGALQRIAYSAPTGGTTTVTFSNVPQSFQDLQIVISARNPNDVIEGCDISFNGIVGGTSYSRTFLTGDGAGAASSRQSSVGVITAFPIPRSSSNAFAAVQVHILNYANSTTFKTLLSRSALDQNGSGQVQLLVGLAQITNPITTVTIVKGGNGFAAGSTFALYGVRASAA